VAGLQPQWLEIERNFGLQVQAGDTTAADHQWQRDWTGESVEIKEA